MAARTAVSVRLTDDATMRELNHRFLRIDELPHRTLQRKDWKLTASGVPERVPELKPYEASLYWKLFPANKTETTLSELRGHFADDLQEVEGLLYKDAAQGGWFAGDPRWTRATWIVVGALVGVLGFLVAAMLGGYTGWGLAGLAMVPAGLAQVVGAFFMPRRTAAGSRLLDQALGFRLYMTTAERYRQQFAERENISTAFLPYAIVFGCVERWARAFQDLDQAQRESGWYGSGGWQALALSQSLQDFNDHLGATLAAPPPSSGGSGSGFGGGGFSGGGGGGGGGGSW